MAAKEKTSSRLVAWLAPLLLLLAAVAAAVPAPASMAGALETRAWEKTSSPLESRPLESLQLLKLHQQNGHAGYNDALGSPLAAENAAFKGLTADEITAINRAAGGTPTLTGDPATIVANQAYREGFWDKTATALRDIAGRHMFDDANKRTAQAVVEELMQRNGVAGPTSAQIRSVIDQVSTGQLRTVEEISAALQKTH
jgi:prophage maintenance system killer protein